MNDWHDYRSHICHTCRKDSPRAVRATEEDEKNGCYTVQELVCRHCKKRRRWWWFAKLPLTSGELKAVQNRGGKAW
jgi:hypothetical protein